MALLLYKLKDQNNGTDQTKNERNPLILIAEQITRRRWIRAEKVEMDSDRGIWHFGGESGVVTYI